MINNERQSIIVTGITTGISKTCRNIREAFSEAYQIQRLGEVVYNFEILNYSHDSSGNVTFFSEKFSLNNSLEGDYA